MPEQGRPATRGRPLSEWIGWALAVSSLICFLGAGRSRRVHEDLFFDSLSNEIHIGGGVTLLLFVVGLVLAVNALTLLVWSWRHHPRRSGTR